MSRRATLTLAVVLLYSAPVVSHAADAPPRVSMRWNAPDDCPDDAALMQAVEGLLGQALMSQEQQLAISINVLGGSGGYSAKLSFKGPQGSLDRFLEHPDCSKLAEAVAQVAPLPIASGALKLAWSAVSKWLIVGFVVGLGGAGAASQIWAPAALASSPAIALSAAPIASSSAAEAAPPAAVASAPPSETPEVPPRPGGPVSAPTTSTGSDDQATFDAELRLITAAKSELDRGRAPQAKAWLAEHAQRFPGGVFATEREALQILVQCSQIREPDAAREFLRRHPGSPMTERLLRACTPPVSASAPSAVEFPK